MMRLQLKDFFAKNGIPILLSTAVLASAAYIYSYGTGGYVIGFSLFAAVYSCALFALYEALHKINKVILSTLAEIISIAVITAVGYRLFETDMGTAAVWFMEPSRFTVIYGGNIAALILIAGLPIISSVYYFTRVRFRLLFVFLVCMCPFCLFAKTFTEIPVLYTIIITTLFFLLMISLNNGGFEIMKQKGIAASAGVFMLAVTMLASFLPKMEYAPYREQFDELITGISIGAAGKQDFSSFASSSAQSVSDDDRVVFYVYGDNPVRIKRQCYNRYDSRTASWGYEGEWETGWNNWQSYTGFENPAEMLDLFGFDTDGISSRNCVVESAEGAIHAIYTCENMSLIQFDDIPYRGIYRSPADEYFLAYDNDVKPKSYRMSWSEFEIDSSFSSRYDSETAQRYAETVWGEAYLKAKEDADLSKAVLMSEETRRACWKSDESYERAKKLTAEITAGCTTDYQKAEAICNYFHTSDFVYDKEFTASDSSIENFIFNTKRGVCFNYATAMTLMCREAGLNSRYCEGFLVKNYDEDRKCWVVTAENSHAFVQVWIDGYGWTDFDPTSNNIDGGYSDLTFLYVGATVGVIGTVIALCLFLRPYVAESRLRGKIKRSRGRKQAALVYNSIGDMLVKYSGGKENTFTPTELSDECARLFDYDISGFIGQYSRLVYSKTEDSGNDFSGVYSEFRKAYSLQIKKDRKNKRKNKKK